MIALLLSACTRSGAATQSQSPLAAWNDGPVKRAILDFVERTTTPGNNDFIPVEDRIATFDHDGTLWPEEPIVQAVFVNARVKAAAAANPGLKQRQPFKAILEGDLGYLRDAGEPALMELLAMTSANMTDGEYTAHVREFFATARHPKLGLPFRALAYRPMLELLDYLRARDFQIFISTGGGADFVRVISQELYGVPPERVIGSALKKELRRESGGVVLWRKPAVAVINDKETKPVNIDAHVGKRPVMAAGNVRSGGDIAMLEYSDRGDRPDTGSQPAASLQLMINHDDAAREFAYGEKDGASLAAARAHGWHVVSIKRDWRAVFAPAGDQQNPP